MQILPNGKCQFIDQSGAPLANGSVYFYAPGTTNPLTTYQDSAGSTPNTNPIQLDSRGQALIWGNATYRQIVKDASGVTVWDQIVSAAASAAALAGTGGAALIGTPDGSNLASLLSSGISRVVDSIAALRAISKANYTRAFVAGYYAPSDGGGGPYQYDASDTSSADNGGTIIVANDGGRWKLQFSRSVDVAQFGGDRTGAADSTSAFVNALAALAATGGELTVSGRFRIASGSPTVPPNVTIRGLSMGNGGQKQSGFNFGALGSVIFLNGSYTINMSVSSALSSVVVMNDSLRTALPFANAGAAAAAISAYSGTAITATGDDVLIDKVSVFGFNWAFSSVGWARTKIDWFSFDCTNGILIDTSHDVARLSNCHGQPYLTTNQTWTTLPLLQRAGTAFSLQNYFDTGTLVNCFEYGWQIGFDCETAVAVSFVNCIADNNGVVGGDVGQIGFKFGSSNPTGQNLLARMIGCSTAAQHYGVYVNGTVRLQIDDCNLWGNAAHIYSDQHETLSLYGNQFDYLNGNFATQSGIVLTNTVTGTTAAVGNTFSFIGDCWRVSSNPLRMLTAVRNTYSTGTVSNLQEQVVYQGAAMSSLNDYSYNNTVGIVKRGFSARGPATAPTILANNDPIWGVSGNGFDGASWVQAAGMRCQVQGAPASGSMPAAWILSTNNGSGQADRLGLHNQGYLYPITDNAYSLGQSANRFSTVYAATGTINTSDGNTKTDIENATLGLDFISALRPVSYKFKVGGTEVVRQVYRDSTGAECAADAESAAPAEIITQDRPGTRTHWGLIAQEVKATVDKIGVDFAGWTIENKDDPSSLQGLRYDQFIAPLIKAVQELSAEVEALKAKAS